MSHSKPRRRPPVLLLLALLMSLAMSLPTRAQVVDDTDIDITTSIWSTWGNVRCLKLAATAEEVVATFIHQTRPGLNSDHLNIVVSRDRGRSWTTLYQGRLGDELFMKDMAIVIADGYPGHPQNRRIYILQEIVRPNVWNSSTWSRFLLLVEGPLDQPWRQWGTAPRLSAVRSTRDADPSLLNEPLHPTLTLAPYASHNKYMVVVSYRWLDDGDSRIEMQTPLSGDRGSGFGTTTRVVAGPGGVHQGGAYAHPSISSDPEGRWLALAFEDKAAGTALVTLADVETLRKGTAGFLPEFETDSRLGLRYAPHVGVHDSTVVMTTLGVSDPRYPGTAELVWYVKEHQNPFQERGLLHNYATSSAPVDFSRGIVYVVAHVAPDPSNGVNLGVATAFSGFARRSLAMTSIGDHLTFSGTPTLCVLEEGSERAIFGYTEHDVWNASVRQGLWVDPGRL